jgi:serine/threonine protein kinase
MPFTSWKNYLLDNTYVFSQFMVAADGSVISLARKVKQFYRVAFEVAIGTYWESCQGIVEQGEKKTTALIKLVEHFDLTSDLTPDTERNHMRMIANEIDKNMELIQAYYATDNDQRIQFLQLFVTITNVFSVSVRETVREKERDQIFDGKFAIVYPPYDLNAAEYIVFMHEKNFAVETKRRNVRSIIEQTLKALSFLHDNDYIYANLVLSNIIINQNENGPTVRLADFSRMFKIEYIQKKFEDPNFTGFMPPETKAYEIIMRQCAREQLEIRVTKHVAKSEYFKPSENVKERLKTIKPTTAVDIWSCGVVASQLLQYAEFSNNSKIVLKDIATFLTATDTRVKIYQNAAVTAVVKTYQFLGAVTEQEWSDAYFFLPRNLEGVSSRPLPLVTDQNAHEIMFGMDRKFNDVTHLQFIKLIRQMLRYNPADRITAKTALKDYTLITHKDKLEMHNQPLAKNTDEFTNLGCVDIDPIYKKARARKTKPKTPPKTTSPEAQKSSNPPAPEELSEKGSSIFNISPPSTQTDALPKTNQQNIGNPSFNISNNPNASIFDEEYTKNLIVAGFDQDDIDLFKTFNLVGASDKKIIEDSDLLNPPDANAYVNQFFAQESQEPFLPPPAGGGGGGIPNPKPVETIITPNPKPVKTIITGTKRPGTPPPPITGKKPNVIYESDEKDEFADLLKTTEKEEDLISTNQKVAPIDIDFE